MKQIWQEFKPCIILAAIAVPLLIAALVLVIVGHADSEPIRLDVPAASEVTVCYYIPDVGKPYEQTWYGGDKLEGILNELAALEFTEANEAPDEGDFRAALVVATEQEQITVLWDREYRAWVCDEERGWLYEAEKD